MLGGKNKVIQPNNIAYSIEHETNNFDFLKAENIRTYNTLTSILNRILSSEVYRTSNIPWDVIHKKTCISSSSLREEKLLHKKSVYPLEITHHFSEPTSTISTRPEGLREWHRECGAEIADTTWGMRTQGGQAAPLEESFPCWSRFETEVETACVDDVCVGGSIVG